MASRNLFLDTATTLGKIIGFFAVAILAGVLVAGLAMPAGLMAGAAANAGTEMLDELPDELQEEPLSTPSRLLANDGETVLATFYAENRIPVTLDEISPHMQDAIVAIEDERFYEHGGVDTQGLARAIVNNLTTDSTQGASTITQQYVNNVLVNYQNLNGLRTTVSGRKTEADKLREMKLAVNLEQEMSKDEILEGYLNIVLFSGRLYGVESASRYFFSKTAADLNIQEAATLAGMVQAPNALNPETNPEAATARRNTVINSMYLTGKISEEERDAAQATEIELNITPINSGCISASNSSGYFCDYVQRKILSSPTFGPDVDSRQRLLDRGGLEIVTTLDADMQSEAAETAQRHVPREDVDALGATLVTVENGTGNILAMAQNTLFDAGDQRGHTMLNLAVDHADGGGQGFQAGSTLKPFMTLAWLGAGNKMTDVVDASRSDYSNEWFDAYCLPGGRTQVTGPWKVRNAIANRYRPMPMNYGLYWSLNSAAVAATHEIDMCAITDVFDAAGIHYAHQRGGSIDPRIPSNVLGAPEVSPLTMASAYSTLATYGTYCQPRAILKVTDSNGEEYDVPPVQCNENALNEDDIKEMNTTLKGIGMERTAQGALPFEIAGKTGTNNYQSSAWFVGYTEGLSTAAWMGRYEDIGKALTGIPINGRTYANMWGSIISGPMWVDYMGTVAEKYPTGNIIDTDPGNPRTGTGATRTGNGNNSNNSNQSSSAAAAPAEEEPAAETAEAATAATDGELQAEGAPADEGATE